MCIDAGISGNSYGLHCASLAGMPSVVIARASTILNNFVEKLPITNVSESKLMTKSNSQSYKPSHQLSAAPQKHSDVHDKINNPMHEILSFFKSSIAPTLLKSIRGKCSSQQNQASINESIMMLVRMIKEQNGVLSTHKAPNTSRIV